MILYYFQKVITSEKLLVAASKVAKDNNTPIISSYLDDKYHKNQVALIDEYGDRILERKKSKIECPLLNQSECNLLGIKVGYMLCCEMFLDNIDFEDVEIIFNPIGVGMFSEEQYKEWTGRAQELAMKNKCYVIGASHADGSYQNAGTSIPLAFVYGKSGEEIFKSKSDIRSVVVDLDQKSVVYIDI